MSETYRQTSVGTDKTRQRDPAQPLAGAAKPIPARRRAGARHALAVSGLLCDKIGGPSVKPYQPPGYWVFLNFPKRDWTADKGNDQYRRGLYTYWQRTFLHPSLLAFDASTREECVVDRPRSNTPLQALVLLNDPTYVESARCVRRAHDPRGGRRCKGAHRTGFPTGAIPSTARSGGVRCLIAARANPLRPVPCRPVRGAGLARHGARAESDVTSTQSSWRPGHRSPA